MTRKPSRCRGSLLCLLLAYGTALALWACNPLESPETGEPAAAPPRTASTSQALTLSPEISLPLSVPGGSQLEVVAASAGDVSLVVWSETDTSGAKDIRGMRLRKSDGALLDATPLCIACGPRAQYAPSVASNGTDFLVTWYDRQVSGLLRMMSVRVRGSDGAVLGPARVLKDEFPASYANNPSSIASDGSNYLVVWAGNSYGCEWGPSGHTCIYRPGIYGARVSAADGSSSSTSVSSTGSSWYEQPHVTYGGGNYLVTWAGSSGTYAPPTIYAVRLRAWDGAVLDWTPRTISSGRSNPVAAFDGSRFLVAWKDSPHYVDELRAARLEQDGTVLDPGGFLVAVLDLNNTWGYIGKADVLFDGADYRVAWVESEGRYGYISSVRAVRVTPEGRVVNGSKSRLVSQPTGSRPALTSLGRGRFLVGYSRATRPPIEELELYEYHAKLRVVEDRPLGTACTQGAQCQSGLCVDGVCCESTCGGGAAHDCQACSVAAGGSVDGTCDAIQANVVCRPSEVACDVAETCDGSSFSCPADDASPSEPDLSGDKCEDSPCDVATWLASLGPDSLEPSFGQGLLSTASSACLSFQSGDTQSMQGQLRALSHQVRAQAGRKLSVSVADTLLTALLGLFRPSACVPVQAPAPAEPTPAPITQGPFVSPELSLPSIGWQTEIAAASAGDITLVVWSETDAYGYRDVRGVRVRKSDGKLLDATSLCIACFTGEEYAPAVASNGTDFLVIWNEQEYPGRGYIPGSTPLIRGVRVKGSTGALIQPYIQLGDGWEPSSVASDGSNYLVVRQGYDVECIWIPGQDWPNCEWYRAFLGTWVSSATAGDHVTFTLTPSSRPPSYVATPQVAYGGGNYLVTWSDDQNAYATRVRASDNVVLDKTTPLTLGSGASGTNSPVAAFDGSHFLVTWSTLGGELRASRLGLEGEVLDPGGFPVGTGKAANILFDGSDYLVAWEQGQSSTARQLKGARVAREGHVVSGSEFIIGDNNAQWWLPPEARPALAHLGPGRFLVGYRKNSEGRVKLRFVEDIPQGLACTQDAQCQSGFCVDGVCCASACGGGSANDCQACSVAAGGAVDGTCGTVRPNVVCRPSVVACDVAEVCDGTSLSCPADAPSASEPDLTCDKCQDNPCDVANHLAWLGPELLLQPIGPGLQLKADAACASFQAGDAQATQSHLKALLNEVRAQSGKKLSTSVADTLAASITGLLGL